MKIDKNVWTDAKCAAFRVEFLTSREELFLYAKAIYSPIPSTFPHVIRQSFSHRQASLEKIGTG